MISESHNLQTYANFGIINAFTEGVHALREQNKANNAVAVARRSAFTETNWEKALGITNLPTPTFIQGDICHAIPKSEAYNIVVS